MPNGPTKHLTWKELACHDGTPYPEEWKGNRAILLAETFEVLRHACNGKSIKILSAFRTPAHNKKIGGAQHSQHLQGRALDMVPPDGYTVDDFYTTIKKLSEFTPIRGIGLYKTFVHMDIRPSTRVATWSGTGAKDSRS